MLVLGIETSTPTCAAALWRQGSLLGEIRFKQKNLHAEILSELITEILKRSGCSIADVDGVAVSSGPGSFTGLRIGMAMAKGIAFARQTPIVGVPTPDAIASCIAPGAPRLAIVLPSRRGEVYAAPYRNLDGMYSREGKIEPVELDGFEEWAADIEVLAGPGAERLHKAGMKHYTLLSEVFWEIGAAGVARLGARRFLAGETDDLGTLTPEYVKPVYITQPAAG